MNAHKSNYACELAFEKRMRQKLSAILLALQQLLHDSDDSIITDDAWIIAPHPDDEVLGCGGTILRKRRLGAEIRVVFLTNGSKSHEGALSQLELGQRRKAEALKACHALDISHDRVFFLEQTDGYLIKSIESCTAMLEELFRESKCSQFFIPHRMEDPDDHRAARLATLAALGRRGLPVDLIEYPVWCWCHWPWVPLVSGGSGLRRVARRVRELLWTWRWLSGCRTWVDVSDVVVEKRRALEEYTSQMFGLPEAPEAPTLSNLRNGEFIERLLGHYEIFKTYHTHNTGDSDHIR